MVEQPVASSCADCLRAEALFTEHLGLLSRSVAFPELAAPVLLHLRRFSKSAASDNFAYHRPS